MNPSYPTNIQRPGTPMPGLGLERSQSPILNEKASGNFLFRVWKWIQEFFYDYAATLAYGIGLIAAGILVAPAMPALVIPSIGTGIGLLASALVTKTLKQYTCVPLTNLQNVSVSLMRDYPQVHIIAFIVTIFIGSLSAPAAFAAGAAIGLMSGFTTHPSMLNKHRAGEGSSLRRSLSSIKA